MSDELIPDRVDYGSKPLERGDLANEPMPVFREWMQTAVDSAIREANAVCLCTVDQAGHPDGRIVLIKGIEDHGLLFYTHYESRKGRQLAYRSQASMVCWWEPLRRQVRLSGRVESLGGDESDAYFASRPRESQLGAWASKQSAPVASREELIERLQDVDERFPADVPRPAHWGGYRLVPSRFEFWQGRDSRLHDRFEYSLGENGLWEVQRLMP